MLKSDLYEAVAGYKTLIKESLWPTKLAPAVMEQDPTCEDATQAVTRETVASQPTAVQEKTAPAEGEL